MFYWFPMKILLILKLWEKSLKIDGISSVSVFGDSGKWLKKKEKKCFEEFTKK